jgi:hypothetical protein
MHFADASVYISCAMMLSVFDFSKSLENGQVIEPEKEYTSSTIRYAFSIYIRVQAVEVGDELVVILNRSNVASNLAPSRPRNSLSRI